MDENDDEGTLIKPKLPCYLADAFGDLYEEDGLCCLGAGLQWECLLASFVRYYADPDCLLDDIELAAKKKNGSVKRPLIIILGLRDECDSIIELLQTWGTPTAQLPLVITNESGQTKERSQLYHTGGILIITSRILIVDMLNGTVQADDIDGMLVAHAESVTDTSTEAFILRIYASQNKSKGFIKAFSGDPISIMSGFAKVDKILRNLSVRKLYLYPRFQTTVRDELDSANIKVTELHQELSVTQRQIQTALAVLVTQCLRQLKNATEHLLTWSSISPQDCITNELDRTISRQLEPVWNRLNAGTKQLVQDLRVLRTLMHTLVVHDCVTYYKFLLSLQTLSAASRHASLWLLEPAAQTVFHMAQSRVYQTDGKKLSMVLEENPKWKLLKDTLEELPQETCKTILVLVQDSTTVETLQSYLAIGRVGTLRRKWLRYLETVNDKYRSVNKDVSDSARLLLEEEGRCRRLLNEQRKKRSVSSLEKQKMRQKRRIVEAKGRGTTSTDDIERQHLLDEAVEALDATDDAPLRDSAETDPMFHITEFDNQKTILHSCGNSGLPLSLLQDVEPDAVIFYHASLEFVRSVEVYSALRDDPVSVYMLLASASAEEKTFSSALERERSAFERLIHHKQTMPEPVFHCATMTQEMQQAQRSAVSSYNNGSLPLAIDTRKRKATPERRRIAVDVREFRSALPSILHLGGMMLAPVTLTVGDFVLTSAHCVERKTVPDLYGSFANGRLITQTEAMSKYYACPCLLIEFDPKKSFGLQNLNELGTEIKNDSITSKLVILTMNFPKLRILWSISPHETLKTFKLLKAKHDEVDVEKAVEIGKSDSEEHLLPTYDEDEINEPARDVLLRLPGMTIAAARRIMAEVDCLSDLCQLPRDDLRKIAGPVIGQKLFTFFRQKMGAT